MDQVSLRLSITDRCNLRCDYCMPAEGVPHLEHREVLRYEEALAVARALSEVRPLRKVRVTGGEPLVRRGVVQFIALLASALPGVELCLTTNGALLAPVAGALKDAGLRRVNVSLDSLDPDRYRALTRGGELAEVLGGIRAAVRAGLAPVKVNGVLLKGVNDDEGEAFVRFATDEGVEVRFLELMSIGSAARVAERRFVSGGVMLQRLSERFDVTPLGPEGTAEVYRMRRNGHEARVGFIRSVTEPFCGRCDRMRLDARGRLFPCLWSDGFVDAGRLLRSGASADALREAVREAVLSKVPRNGSSCVERMSAIGG